jgi:hypothetical protein
VTATAGRAANARADTAHATSAVSPGELTDRVAKRFSHRSGAQ